MLTVCRELKILAAAQRRLLPQPAPELPGYRLCLAYRPSRTATGDYHDFFPRPTGGWRCSWATRRSVAKP